MVATRNESDPPVASKTPGKCVPFTAERVAKFSAEPGKHQTIYKDAKTPGLGVRVTANWQAPTDAGKSYIFEAKLHGKSLRVTIGDVRTWALAKAQEEARSLKAMTDKGIDPREVAATQRASARAKRAEQDRHAVTLASAWAAYIDARQHKWSARHLADHHDVADPGGRKAKRGPGVTRPGVLASLMPLRLGQIDAATVKGWLAKEAATRPTRADLAYRLFRTFLSWCDSVPEYAGIVPASAADKRIAKDTLPKRTAKRDCLQKEQLPGWFAAVRAIRNPTLSAYLQVLLLTGARRESLAELRWTQVDFRWKSMEIRDKVESHGGEDGTRIIPLTPYIGALLLDLKRRAQTPPPRYRILHGKRIENDLSKWKPSPWVFASKTAASGRLEDPTRAHDNACAVAGIEGLTLHGLRRSFDTLSEWLERPEGVVAQIMGHRPSATAERHYKVRPLDLLRLWHTRIEAWFLEQAGIDIPPEDESTLRVVSG